MIFQYSIKEVSGGGLSQNISLKAVASAVKKYTTAAGNKMLTKSVKHTTQ